MSTIIGNDNTDSLLETRSADGGFQFIGKQDQQNIIEIKGDTDLSIVGGSLEDKITTGAGNAIVFAGDGNDMVTGGNGNDILRGGEGDDTIRGGLGDDVIIGGEGDDVIRGGFGSDLLKGSSGADIFEFSASEFGSDMIDQIVDFKDDDFADTIKIFGVGVGGDVDYDETTGIVSVNGDDAIDIGIGKDVDFKVNEDNGTWDLF